MAVGARLKTALELAKTGAGWVELAGQLEPTVRTVAEWLGGEWKTLLTLC